MPGIPLCSQCVSLTKLWRVLGGTRWWCWWWWWWYIVSLFVHTSIPRFQSAVKWSCDCCLSHTQLSAVVTHRLAWILFLVVTVKKTKQKVDSGKLSCVCLESFQTRWAQRWWAHTLVLGGDLDVCECVCGFCGRHLRSAPSSLLKLKNNFVLSCDLRQGTVGAKVGALMSEKRSTMAPSAKQCLNKSRWEANSTSSDPLKKWLRVTNWQKSLNDLGSAGRRSACEARPHLL